MTIIWNLKETNNARPLLNLSWPFHGFQPHMDISLIASHVVDWLYFYHGIVKSIFVIGMGMQVWHVGKYL